LKYIPAFIKTPEFYAEIAGKIYGELETMPEKILRPGYCLKLVRKSGEALFSIPEHLITFELCAEALLGDSYYGGVMNHVPGRFKTKEFCLAAVRVNGVHLEGVPEALKTEEFYMEAVRENRYAFEYVPEHLKTEAVCIEAAAHFYNRYGLCNIPKKLLSEDFFLKAVQKPADFRGSLKPEVSGAGACVCNGPGIQDRFGNTRPL
jgi:hypothetical protein